MGEEALDDIAHRLQELSYIKESLQDMISGRNPIYEIPKKLDDINGTLGEILNVLTKNQTT